MENPEEILHCLEEFSKLKPKDIPRELEDYLCFVAKTGDPVYQWGTIKSLFKEKLINVITDFYESCPSVEIPPCPNVEVFNYESMKTFILEKLDTFAAAPFTVQRICELLTSPRKEYNRIDKYMRALEKNILVVSTTEPGFRRATENGEGIVNGIETEHLPDSNSLNNDINVEEMDDTPVWSRITHETVTYQQAESNNSELQSDQSNDAIHSAFSTELKTTESNCPNTIDSVITRRPSTEQPYVSIEPIISDSCLREENVQESDITVTITAIPATVQKRRDSMEPVVSSGEETVEEPTKSTDIDNKENPVSSPVKSDTNEESNSPSEPEPSNIEETNDTVDIPDDKKEVTEADETYTSSESNESTLIDEDLIQIPIISEISGGDTSPEQDCEDSNVVPMLSLHTRDDVIVDDNAISKEESESILETSAEVSTTVTSTVDVTESQTFIRENDTIVSKESVSSTNELSLNVSSCTKHNIDINVCHEDTISDSILDTNLNESTTEENENKEIEGRLTLSEIHGYAASSTNQEPMDIDLGEESCQEPPTSDG